MGATEFEGATEKGYVHSHKSDRGVPQVQSDATELRQTASETLSLPSETPNFVLNLMPPTSCRVPKLPPR